LEIPGHLIGFGVFEPDKARIVPYRWIVKKDIVINFDWLEDYVENIKRGKKEKIFP
jgi:hypothetical protein